MKGISVLILPLLLLISATIANGQQGNRMKIDLSGKWKFSRDETKAGVKEKWYDGELKTIGNGPEEIGLPGSTDEAGAGIPNPGKPTLDGLYRPNIFTGTAWYQREINIPETWKDKHVTLFLERNHWTTQVWLDGKYYGSHDNLISPHIYELGTDITPGKHRLTICVDNTLKYNLGSFVSINSEETQTNWNGIAGRIELSASDPVSLNRVDVYPDIYRKLIRIKALISNLTGSPVSGNVQFSVRDADGTAVGQDLITAFFAPTCESSITTEFPMGDNIKLWDEFTPNLYTLQTTLSTKSPDYKSYESVSFGMRKFETKGTMFTMNGRPVMLRGTLECCIFPLTGYPPTDVESWLRIYNIIKSYGLNHIRFHSWTPPDAAFTAADRVGIMIQTEGPQSYIPSGKVPLQDEFMEKELMEIIDTYGNHPSFCLMTLGNEYGGDMELITHWVEMLKQADPRHLYSSASSFYQVTPNRQFTVSTTGRGIQGPSTMGDATIALKKQDSQRPILGHEIGQWTFYPNFDEIEKYTGVLKAKNFELVRDDLKDKGLSHHAKPFFHSTGQHARLLYKEEIENLLRTPDYAGFALLDLHDYPGCGTALVGLLDPFWDSKGLIKPEEHIRYCGPTVPLIRIPKRTYTSAETFSAKVELAHFGATDIKSAEPEWTIRGEKGQLIAFGSLDKIDLATGNLHELGNINVSLNKATAPGKFTVTVSLKNTPFSNSWEIWIYPPPATVTPPKNVMISHSWDGVTRTALAEGKRVILFPGEINSTRVRKGSFLPVFWSPVWTKQDPSTMSLLCDPGNPLFSQFPTDAYSNWQWWNLIQGSQTMILNDTPAEFRPLVQIIDNFARNDKLGNVFEAKVEKGSLLVCTLNLKDKTLPETTAFLNSLYLYAGSKSFKPSYAMDFDILDKIFEKSVPAK